MKRSTRRILLPLILSTLGLTASVIFASAASASHNDQDLSTWAPTSVVTVMNNNTSNVAYWFKWEGPSSTTNHRWSESDSVFEFGYKDTDNNGCDNDEGWLGKAGFPPNMDIEVDWTEDTDDAVIWMDNIASLKINIDGDPSFEPAVWWNCSQSNHFDEDAANPFQVSLNECDIICEPLTTFTAETYNYIPAEQAGKSVPNDQFDNRAIQTNMIAPWTNNWNFESGVTGWTAWNASRSSITNLTAYQGSKYVYVQPNQSGKGNQINTRLRQSFDVKTSSTKDPGGYELGSNTNISYEGYFRCPTWAPGWAGLPSGTPCSFSVRWKTAANGAWREKNYFIPANGAWHRVYFESDPAQTSDDDLILHLNTKGFPMDVDAQWITSGI